jgi:hypothetical protein
MTRSFPLPGFSFIAITVMTIFSSSAFGQKIPPIIKTLEFDTTNATIKDPSDATLAVEKGKLYKFRLQGANSAYYDANANFQQLKKNVAIPASLQGIIPDGTVTTRAKALIGSLESKFIIQLASENSLLQHMLDTAQTMLDTLSNHPNSIVLYQTLGLKVIKDLADSFNITPFVDDSTIVQKLTKAVDSVIVDFDSRVQLLRDKGALPEDDFGASVYRAAATIGKNENILRALPATLYACRATKNYIDSKPYKLGNADYLMANFTIYAAKFASSKDSLFSKSILFFRTKYFRFDVTSGFFYSNLTSQYFYFTDSAGHYQKETRSRFDLSVGALVNFNYVFTPVVKAGICAGGGLSLLDAKTKALVGLDLTIGHKAEFAFSGGLALSSIPTPSHTLGNTTYPYVSSPEGTVPVYSKLTAGFFIGVTYSFLKF